MEGNREQLKYPPRPACFPVFPPAPLVEAQYRAEHLNVRAIMLSLGGKINVVGDLC